ncbi:MAG: RNA polymerase sigma factor [Planctomycetales bacterium]|nr:RNA polymerase sigma factor [Planctomycetales bacterium]
MSDAAVDQVLAEVYNSESRRVFATLVRLLGNFELAEEAMNDAFATAAETWKRDGVPGNPRTWLISTGRFKAIDRLRRQAHLERLQPEIAARWNEITTANLQRAGEDIEDDRLRLIFTCCHPAIDIKVQVPLTLREVCGLTTDEIASAFLTSTATMAQRIVRGKAKIRDAKIPIVLPSLDDLPDRLDAVLAVIYLVYNEGYCASSGESLIRTDLADEAIRLARLVLLLLPDPEVMGLLALMLLHESRRSARVTAEGDLILMEDQDRSLWQMDLVTEGKQLVQQSLHSRNFGVYTVQAAISAVHSDAPTADETDWAQIVSLYDLLTRIDSSPVVQLNRAVAIAMRDGPDVGLQAIDELMESGALDEYHLAHAARADLCRRLGRREEARAAYRLALQFAKQVPERRFLQRRLHEVS